MDVIWDQNNPGKNESFRNEIVWCYRGGRVPKRDFSGKSHTNNNITELFIETSYSLCCIAARFIRAS